ncbi:ABC-three component system protein [Mycobacterium sp. PDNC021]|uniref:ABC-three component system protein n=1 Tax=Mycobacterium sp. PDNC021 TaxID=3391399 RepID=UPI003AAC3252
MRIWRPEDLWREVVGTLDLESLNELFPGAPGAQHVELADLLPLLDALGNIGAAPETGNAVLPVPPDKMDFNSLPEASRMEFNAGRLLAPRIDRWYEESSDPDLRDVHGEAFRVIYASYRAVTDTPAELLERLYVSVAGANFRMDGTRANAAFAVVSYFFDSCHIFDTPPMESVPDQEVPSAATD